MEKIISHILLFVGCLLIVLGLPLRGFPGGLGLTIIVIGFGALMLIASILLII